MFDASRILPARPSEGRILSGVCAGLSHAMAFDVTLVRLAFLVLALAWGLGVVLYGGLWLLMPDPTRGAMSDRGARSVLRFKAQSVRVDLRHSARSLSQGWQRVGRDPWPRPVGRRWMAVGLMTVGALFLLLSLGAFSWITPMRAASLVLIVIGAAGLLSLRIGGR